MGKEVEHALEWNHWIMGLCPQNSLSSNTVSQPTEQASIYYKSSCLPHPVLREEAKSIVTRKWTGSFLFSFFFFFFFFFFFAFSLLLKLVRKCKFSLCGCILTERWHFGKSWWENLILCVFFPSGPMSFWKC